MLVINFAHPITVEQRESIKSLSGSDDVTIIRVGFHLDLDHDIINQVTTLIDSVGLTPAEWSGGQYVVNLPSFNLGAACALAEIHGRSGHFPDVLKIIRQGGDYRVAGIVKLQSVRDEARGRREVNSGPT